VAASSKGIIRCELTEGMHNFTLIAPGYNPVSGTIKIKAGTMHQKKIILSQAAGSNAVA
jgi:hypothetical protein